MNISKLALSLYRFHGVKYFAKTIRNYSSTSAVSINEDNLRLQVGKNIEKYPLVWLRDNCTCEQCFHQDSHSRIIDWNKFNVDVSVKNVEANKSDDGVVIEWNDSHKSLFSYKWLLERSFMNGSKKSAESSYFYRSNKTLWSGDNFMKGVTKYDYQEVMNSDKLLYKWIKDLAVYGSVFLENASTDTKVNKQFAERVAFIRKTHYEEEFRVTSKSNTSNVAYLAGALQLHTDLPYYEYVPGVVNLHCITQDEGEGGRSLICDGFYVAEKLRKDEKDAFHILSTVNVNWLDIGHEEEKKFHSEFRSPMISLDVHGNIEKIRHSVPQRGSLFSVDINVVKPWYQALRLFVDLMNKNSANFKLKPGEMLAFDNTRIIHGREDYKDTGNKPRCILGVCMDWDELYSKLRVLEHAG